MARTISSLIKRDRSGAPFGCADDTASRRFKILGDPKRRKIINLLLCNRKSVTEICQEMGVERTLVSHNLKILLNEGILICERIGKGNYYSVKPDMVVDKAKLLVDFGCCQICFSPPD